MVIENHVKLMAKQKTASYIFNIMAADALVMQGAMALSGMALIYFKQNIMLPAHKEKVNVHCQISHVRCTKFQNLNASHLVLQLSVCIILKPGVKSRMKM